MVHEVVNLQGLIRVLTRSVRLLVEWSGLVVLTGASSVVLLTVDVAWAETYHVDCTAGSDAAAGTTPQAAWKTVEKVSATTFAPGDAVLFRRGTRCSGMLWPKGSGDGARPIRMGSYGEGAPAVIDGGSQQAAIKLFNQQGWLVQDLETTGGNPYGIYIGGDAGPLRHFRVNNVIVHDVTGEPKVKHTGLVVVDGTAGAVMEDIVIDGVIAHHTTQWAGVMVIGPSREKRARNVTVRNTVVHDVFGDGIVLFQVEDGLIEKSAAWLTGLQPRETIGTPNGIWTWRCRRCTVRLTEGFFTDSPGVDGGVYDIDWGNDDNVVEYNYAHDAQGYCVAIFGAQEETTANSIVRHNVCMNNGRSPKLARRQGDLYIETWEGGSLDGVLVHNNTFCWAPPNDVPVVQAATAEYTGRRPNRVFDNAIHSAVPSMIASNTRLEFDRNVYWYAGSGKPAWKYGDRNLPQPAGGEFTNPEMDALLRPKPGTPLADRGIGARAADGATGVPAPQPGRWTLKLFPAASEADARSELVFLEAAMAQYGDTRLDAVVTGRSNWPVEKVRGVTAAESREGVLLELLAPSGDVVREWRTFATPADLGLTLRHVLASRGWVPQAGSQ